MYRLTTLTALYVLFAATVIAQVADPAVRGGEASFQGLGDFPDGVGSFATAVSADGSVVVGTGNCGADPQIPNLPIQNPNCGEAFRWTEEGGMEPLGDLPGGATASQAYGVSADGSVVVGLGNAEQGPEAFRWVDGTMTGLGDLTGGSFFSAALAVSADGSVVAGFSSSDSAPFHSFRWEAGVMDWLDFLPGWEAASLASAVSSNGSIIVGTSLESNFCYTSYRWEDGVMVDLGSLPGAGTLCQSQAWGVSSDGSVVVGRSHSPNDGWEGYRWENDEMMALGGFPDGNGFSHAYGISGNGFVVVGQAGLANESLRAFVWTPTEGVRNLKVVLEDDYGLDLTGWMLTNAMGISDDGTTIVGAGINPDGEPEAWRAVFSNQIPPAPITDLDGTPNADGNSVTLSFTAPGNDGNEGTAYRYQIRHSAQPILSETDWENATEATFEATPDSAGTAQEIVVHGLEFATTYHFNVRGMDGYNNLGGLSNDLEIQTLDGPVANVPLDPIEMQVPAEGMGTHELPISNTGGSILTYTVGFTEASEGASAGESRLHGTEYRWTDSNDDAGPAYQWIDISETGTELELELDGFEVVDLPFDFPYYGELFNQVSIESKGALSFGAPGINHVNQEIPVEDDWNGLLAVHWDDFNLTGEGTVYYDTLDDGRFVVSWVDAAHYPERGSYTFQAVLDERGTIRYHYQEIAPEPEDENSATVGIENLDGTDGLQVVYNAPYLQDELAVRFSTHWVESSLAGGAIPAGGDETLVLGFDARGFDPGTYTGEMTITTNEVDTGLTLEHVIPITFTVQGVGTEGTPDELAAGLTMPRPNPVRGTATFAVAAREAQDVTVEVFDVTGRRVQTLYDGALAAGTAETLALDASALPAGVYVIRATGEDFTETRRVTVVR